MIVKTIKIQDTNTGLFSRGGGSARFTKKGKTWAEMGHVSLHLLQYTKVPSYWDIVVVEVDTEAGTVKETRINAAEKLKQLEANRVERNAKKQERILQERKERLERELAAVTRQQMLTGSKIVK